MRARVPRGIYGLLIVYIAISFGYELVSSVSFIVGYFDLRHQVKDPGIAIDDYKPMVTDVGARAQKAGVAKGDSIESIDGIRYDGRAVLQKIRFFAHPGDILQVGASWRCLSPVSRAICKSARPSS
jgi:hypothetical protein